MPRLKVLVAGAGVELRDRPLVVRQLVAVGCRDTGLVAALVASLPAEIV